MTSRPLLLLVLIALLGFTGSCANNPGVTYVSHSGTGAALGGLTGGVIGHNSNLGAWEGAALGGLLGGLLGEVAGRPAARSTSPNPQYPFYRR